MKLLFFGTVPLFYFLRKLSVLSFLGQVEFDYGFLALILLKNFDNQIELEIDESDICFFQFFLIIDILI